MMAQPLCATDDPALRPLTLGHDAACHFA